MGKIPEAIDLDTPPASPEPTEAPKDTIESSSKKGFFSNTRTYFGKRFDRKLSSPAKPAGITKPLKRNTFSFKSLFQSNTKIVSNALHAFRDNMKNKPEPLSTRNSLETIESIYPNNDKLKRDLIRSILCRKRFMHPEFAMAYEPVSCIYKGVGVFYYVGPNGFCCIYTHIYTKEKVCVKFVLKSLLTEADYVKDPVESNSKIPFILLKYREANIHLPEFVQEYEDNDLFYIITTLEGNIM